MTSVRVLHGHKGPVRDIKVNNSFNIVTVTNVKSASEGTSERYQGKQQF